MFGKEKTKSKYKLILLDDKYLITHIKEYVYTDCWTDLSGKIFCIFERKKGLRIERVKFAKEDLEINHETKICRLKVNRIKT